MPWALVRGARGRLGLTQTQVHSLQDDQEETAAQERDRAAATGPGNYAAPFVLGQQVDLHLGLPALFAGLLAAPLQTRRLMTRPMHVR